MENRPIRQLIAVGAGSPVFKDYALISRIRNSETGHVVVVIGGLYTYGTQAAGEFLTDPQWIQAIAKVAKDDSAHQKSADRSGDYGHR